MNKCEICEIVTNSKVKSRNHFKHNHNNRGELHQCNVCKKSFQTKYALVSISYEICPWRKALKLQILWKIILKCR